MRKLLTLFFLSCNAFVFAQEQWVVRSIQMEGLKVTKEATVLRELTFQVGDTLAKQSLENNLEQSKSNLQNQWLFNFIDFSYQTEADEIDIHLKVRERWYVWPYPIFEISERNFNVFWDSLQQSNFQDFSRLNYGVFFNWYNFRGRNELLKIKIRKGYREHYLFEYNLPYINKAKSWGATFKAELFRMEQFHYLTNNNQLLYANGDDILLKDQKISFALQHKPGLYSTHTITTEHSRMQVSDGITLLNPNFFPSALSEFQYLALDYSFVREKRDFKTYPLKGSYQELCMSLYQGMGNNYQNASISAKLEQHLPLHSRWFFGNSIKAKVSLQSNTPYVLNEALGFDDYLRGYEYYVMDGSKMALSKSAIKWAAVPKRTWQLPFIPWSQFNKTHYSIYFSIFADMGIAYNNQMGQDNPLNNQFLMSQGISMDIVTYYDKLIRLECSRNHLGERGLFIHFSNPF